MSYSHVANEDVQQNDLPTHHISTKPSTVEISNFLLPYFWPEDSNMNKLRCLSTGIMVSLSKAFNVAAPLYLSRATNALVTGKYGAANLDIVVYVCLKFMSSLCKGEGNTYIYTCMHACIRHLPTHMHPFVIPFIHSHKQTYQSVQCIHPIVTHITPT